jgi:hypothetical protein
VTGHQLVDLTAVKRDISLRALEAALWIADVRQPI